MIHVAASWCLLRGRRPELDELKVFGNGRLVLYVGFLAAVRREDFLFPVSDFFTLQAV